MNRIFAAALIGLASALGACRTVPDYGRALPEGAPALIPLKRGEAPPDLSLEWEARDEILESLDRSITWTRREYAKRFFPQAGISHERALRSLLRFREVLLEAYGPRDFQRALEEEFTFYRSAGWNGAGGGVLFTAYCTPILKGSLEPTALYRHPLYALPGDLVKDEAGAVLGWETNFGRMPFYPSRGAIEAGGLLAGKGLELVWLSDPIDSFLAHVNGSAFIELEDGSLLRLGYAGKNGRPYTSLGRELEADGRIPTGQASLATIREWAAGTSEAELHDFLHRNESYVFFTPISGNPHGSLDFPVAAYRSIATDKTLFPRGAVTFVEARQGDDPKGPPLFQHVMLDQDTGGAIRTAGRADVYLGIGPAAEAEAGRVKATGQLYYLFVD